MNLKTIDGSSWDPFAERLLYTTESGSTSSIYQATADFPSHVVDISNVIGRGGFEGVQADDRGNLYIAEDVGGKTSGLTGPPADNTSANAFTKQPNSFIYRFVPNDPSDLTKGGKVQALQVLVGGSPLKFTKPASSSQADVAAAANTDISGRNSARVRRAPHLRHVVRHEVDHDRTPRRRQRRCPAQTTTRSPRPPGATPFKRPENGVFRPGSNFKELYFDETGDTDDRTCAGGGPAPNPASRRARARTDGRVRVDLQARPVADERRRDDLRALQRRPGPRAFDNTAFLSKDQIVFVEDAGDTLHTQRNALDSAWLFDVDTDYSHGAQPTRIIAEGRDASATIDSGLSGSSGFVNEGDNEITGFIVSDGDTSVHGLLGDDDPKPFKPNGKWRVFWTQQHGDNNTWEMIAGSEVTTGLRTHDD